VVLRGELTFGWELIAGFVRFITDGTPERICDEFPRLAHQCLLGLGKPSQSLALDAAQVLAFLSLLLPAPSETASSETLALPSARVYGHLVNQVARPIEGRHRALDNCIPGARASASTTAAPARRAR
jgi:hypothetical protein